MSSVNQRSFRSAFLIFLVILILIVPPMYFMNIMHVLVLGIWPHSLTYPLQRSATMSVTWMESPQRLDVSSLSLFDVIIIHNVPATFLTVDLEIELVEKVEQGKGLIMFGGPFSFGLGEYQNSTLSRVLPVTCVSKAFSTQNVTLQKIREHEIIKGVNVSRIRPLGYNILAIKPYDALTLVVDKITNYPIIAIGEYGKGKVVVFAFGETMIDTVTLKTLLSNIMKWLSPDKCLRAVYAFHFLLFTILAVIALVPLYAIKLRRHLRK
jgi:uncharacterized membrane protein